MEDIPTVPTHDEAADDVLHLRNGRLRWYHCGSIVRCIGTLCFWLGLGATFPLGILGWCSVLGNYENWTTEGKGMVGSENGR